MLKFLQSFSIFKNFTTEHIAALYKLLEEELYKKGDFIINEGDEGKSLYLIFSGNVRILKKTDLNDFVEIANLYKGDYFGELALFDHKQRSACVEASEETTLLKFTLMGYSELCRRFPEVEVIMLKGFLTDIITKLRDTSETLTNKGFVI